MLTSELNVSSWPGRLEVSSSLFTKAQTTRDTEPMLSPQIMILLQTGGGVSRS